MQLRTQCSLLPRRIDNALIDEVERAERERAEREALEWAAAEVDDDLSKGDD
jgi:DNA-directed RNA polymerase subunit omega